MSDAAPEPSPAEDQPAAGPLFAWRSAEPTVLGGARAQPASAECERIAMPAPVRTAEALGRFLSAGLGVPVDVVLGRSRRTPIRSETQRLCGAVRHRLVLHRFFATAPDAALDDLLAWMRAGRRARAACVRLDAFIAERLSVETPPPAEPSKQRLAGEHHHLGQLAAALADEPTAAALAELAPWPAIGWGRWPNRAPRRSLQLGSYDPERHLVRIHPVLDRREVPAWFVSSVLHHELVHALLEGGQRRSPRRVHGPEFRALEQAYVHHRPSEEWLEAHLGGLLTLVARRVRARAKELRHSR